MLSRMNMHAYQMHKPSRSEQGNNIKFSNNKKNSFYLGQHRMILLKRVIQIRSN